MGKVCADASQLSGRDRWQQRGTLLGRDGSMAVCVVQGALDIDGGSKPCMHDGGGVDIRSPPRHTRR